MKLLTALVGAATFAAIAAMAQDLTPADDLVNVLDVYHSEDWLSWAEKMPINASLPDEWQEKFARQILARIRDVELLQQEANWELDKLRIVNSDAPVPVHLANWQSPITQPGCSGVCVSFSGQGATALKALTGKRITGFQLVEATTCADHDARFGGGLIIQQANSMGIQTLGSKVGAAVVQQTVDTGWRKLVMLGLEVGTAVALGVTTSGVVAASKSITTGIALGHLALDQLPTILKPGTPNPDPFFTSVLDENAQISIPAGACVSAMFAGTWDKSSVKVTGKVQLLP